MPKLTKRIVENTPVRKTETLLWDSELKGFFCKIAKTGIRSYFLYYRTKDGRQRKPKIGEHGALTCEEARNIARQWLSAVAHGKDPSAERKTLRQNPTLNDLAKRYMTDYAPRKKSSSIKEDLRLWQQHILPPLGSIKVSSLTRDDINKLHHALRKTPTTGNRVLSLLSKALNLAELWGYRSDNSNPCRHIKKYTETMRERFLTQQEICDLLNVLAEEETKGIELPSVLSAIRLLLLTGCRLNEILQLRWEYVNFENNLLFLPDSKTGKKTIYLSPEALKVLQAIPRVVGNDHVIIGKIEGKHLINLQKPWTRIREKAGLKNVRLHDLRHTFASVAAAKGVSLPIIGALMGHKQTQTTSRYAHLVGKPLLEASHLISNQIMGTKND
jgi:integrase